MSLIDVIKQMPNEILGGANAKKYHNQLPLLVKFIDAEKDLSIQVHPDDKMAMREHGKMGKTEMWSRKNPHLASSIPTSSTSALWTLTNVFIAI